MTVAQETSPTEVLEVWENQSDGRVSMEVDGELGRPRRLTVYGKGQRLRILARQRRIVQEGIRLEQNDPFRNGKLIRLNRATVEEREKAEAEGAPIVEEPKGDNELSDAELIDTFLLEGEEFEEAVKAQTEFNIRRLRHLAVEHDAKASQVAFLNDYIAENLTAQGDTPTYREIMDTPDSAIS